VFEDVKSNYLGHKSKHINSNVKCVNSDKYFCNCKNEQTCIGFTKLTQLADNDNTLAQYFLGFIYADLPNEITNCAKYLTTFALNGDEHAQYILGKLHLHGDESQVSITNTNVNTDESHKKNGFKLIKMSAKNGNINAKFHMACLYRDGIYVDRNLSKADNMFKNIYTGHFSEDKLCFFNCCMSLSKIKELSGVYMNNITNYICGTESLIKINHRSYIFGIWR
jgi:TPR repeat protein